MKKKFQFLLTIFFRIALWFRYKVTVKGLDQLTPEHLKKSGGVLFLPNHVAMMVDPVMITLAVWNKFPIRPTIAENYYFLPGVHGTMKLVDALPVPDFEASTNSLKRKRHEKVMHEMARGLEKGENFLLYPAGRVKHTAIENIGGASATHQIIQEAPNANIVLVRLKGLWGSLFSRALTGKTPNMFEGIKKGVLICLKNLLFFTPRRKVVIEFCPAPEDFPYNASRLELNRWLEKWYNRPDGLTEQQEEFPGDSLVLVSYSLWKKEFPEVYQPKQEKKEQVVIENISGEIQKKIFAKLQELTELDSTTITPEMTLASDLGLDSLDISELAAFLQDRFDTGPIPVTELTTVGRVMGIASKKIQFKKEIKEETYNFSGWFVPFPRQRVQISSGKTIPEVFLNTCERMRNLPACADMRSGILSYSRLKLGTIVLAEYIRHIPGKYVGILLPASVGAYLTVLACLLAGKIPLMLNWTVGSRHLRSVRESSQLGTVLTSWAFLEKLDAVDLDGIEDILVMLETVKREFTLRDKLRGFFRSKLSVKRLLSVFGIANLSEDDQAVLLFTSGTENVPKGVPLSHKNLLSNDRAACEAITFYTDDIMLGILPPFHAFGFNTSGLVALLAGVRIAFYPNPTDGRGVAKELCKWGVTLLIGVPSFIKAMLKAAEPGELGTMRICVTGAEKAPPELFQLLQKEGKESTLIEGYGVTECAPILTANRPGKPRKGVGTPLPGVELLLVHPETYEPLSFGKEGLVLARGPNIFSGYLNPGETSPFLEVDGRTWYNTGDIGILDQEYRLTLVGRLKRFVKVAGEMISLLGIESTLLQAADRKGWPIQEAGPSLAVIGREEQGERPRIELITTFSLSLDEANQILREEGFSSLIRITKVHLVEEIPIMGTGKIHYRKLEEQFLAF